MYLIEVIPLTRIPANGPQILSYYFSQDLRLGSVIEITINHRQARAIVISSSPLTDRKMILKKSSYQIKKANKLLFEDPQVNEYQLRVASWISRNYYSPLGISLTTILPPFFGKKKYDLSDVMANSNTHSDTSIKGVSSYKSIAAPAKRMLRSLLPDINEHTKNTGQVLILVPDSTVSAYYYNELKNLDFAPIQISSQIKNKEFFEKWKNVSFGDARIIIGTRTALFLPFNNLELIIIEDSSNDMYKSDMTPKYRATDLAFEIARLNNADVVIADQTPDVESYFKSINLEIEISYKQTQNNNSIKLIDMIPERLQDNLSMFSSELKSEIIQTADDSGKVLIYAPRRGYASLYICSNCGQATNCPNCDIAMRVHKHSQYILNCHHCSLTKDVPKFCPNCQSGNMRPAGYPGSQKIYDKLLRFIEFGQLKKTPILILDSDVVKNDTETEEIINEVTKPGPIILIATAMILSHRYNLNFDLIGVTSIDALSNFSDFKTEEKLLITLNKLLDFNPKKCLLQTSKIESRINTVIDRQDVLEFYNEELQDRKLLFYPPFSKIIKLSYRASDRTKSLSALRLLSEKLKMVIAQNKLEKQIVLKDTFAEYGYRENNYFVSVLILKCDRDYADIRSLLRYVPNDWSIDIDPNSIT